jgi:hypothetical protein
MRTALRRAEAPSARRSHADGTGDSGSTLQSLWHRSCSELVSTPVILLPAESQPPRHNESEGLAPSDPPAQRQTGSTRETNAAVLAWGPASCLSPRRKAALGQPPVAVQQPRRPCHIGSCGLQFVLSDSDLTRLYHDLDTAVLYPEMFDRLIAGTWHARTGKRACSSSSDVRLVHQSRAPRCGRSLSPRRG